MGREGYALKPKKDRGKYNSGRIISSILKPSRKDINLNQICKVVSLALAIFLFFLNQNAFSETYYFSNQGDDANTGQTIETSKKTLQFISSDQVKPGDIFLLKRNDIWEESISPVVSGQSDQLITLGAYGKGAKPKIWPGGESEWIIRLGQFEGPSVDGWRFVDLDIGYSKAGLIFLNSSGRTSGLHLENCSFHDITGAALFSKPYMYYSTAILVHNKRWDNSVLLQNLTLKNITVYRTDSPLHVLGVENFMIDSFSSDFSARQGVLIEESSDGEIKNIRIKRTGHPLGMIWGVAGLQFNSSSRIKAFIGEIAYTTAPENIPDGVGIDFEGSNVDIVVDRFKIHDNADSAILVYRNAEWGSDNMKTSVINSWFYRNGLRDLAKHPAFMRHFHNHRNFGRFSGNRIELMKNQRLNQIDGILVDSWPENYEVLNNNIVMGNPDQNMADSVIKTTTRAF